MIEHRHWAEEERLETSITQDFFLSMRKSGRGVVRVAKAPGPESKYGADLELWLRGGGLLLGLRLQAKSLAPRKRSDGVYQHLHHPIGSDRLDPRWQVDALLEHTKKPLNPAYLFYNGLEEPPRAESACCAGDDWDKRNGRLGLTVTSAHTVAQLRNLMGKPRSLDVLLPHSVPLHCLAVCHPHPFRVWAQALPIAAAEWPLALAGEHAPWVVLDPGGPVPDLANLRRTSAARLYEGPVPGYLSTLLQREEFPAPATEDAELLEIEGEGPSASLVMVISDTERGS